MSKPALKMSIALALLITSSAIQAQIPAGYKGKPYQDSVYCSGAQVIPGRVELAYYDMGGEGVGYHDTTPENEGSKLNHEVHDYGSHWRPGITAYTAFFRENEGVDISYTKDWADFNHPNKVDPRVNQLYIGWQEDGEWTNYTVNVIKPGKYRIITVYGNKDNHSELWLNNNFACKLLLPEETGNWHYWTQATVGEITFTHQGLNLLTLKYNKGANLAYLDFLFIEEKPETSKNANPDWPIITRKGDKLYEGDKVFRFLGLAAPNIQANENQVRADRTNRFPDEYEISDILDGIRREGGRATRTFSLSVFHPDDRNMPVYFSGYRQYNEEAFQCLDRIIALAHKYEVRLIIPFIASQSFPSVRGVDEFSALAGKPKGSFWTDPDQKADFRHFLDFILNRKNTVNGILYKNDPAILAWQLGNEFGSYAGDRGLNYEEWSPKILAWSLEMAAYIKKVDPNHLVMEAGGADREKLMADPNIDVISDHLYEYWNKMGGRPYILAPLALQSYNQCKGKKPLIVDEFGLGTTENIAELMKTIRESGITGGLMWSIRSHRRDGGWYYHNEGGTPVNSFHVPGFSAGFAYDEIPLLSLLRKEAYLIRGIQPPEIEKPSPAPVLFMNKKGFTWRGSTGAAFYTIERAESVNGPWKILRTGLEDSVLGEVSKFEASPESSEPLTLFTDEWAEKGKTSFYRIRGTNEAGDSEWSQILEVTR